MSIIIPGIKMPERCCDCKMYVEDIYCCHLLHREIENPWADDGVELDCPLVPIPPHGRLIDADDIENITVIMNENGNGFNRIIAPIIIPAEPPDPAEKEVEG